MKCSKCGKDIANDSNFCEYCGSPIRKLPNNKIKWVSLVVILLLLGVSLEYWSVGIPYPLFVILLLLVGWVSYQLGKQSSDSTYVEAEEMPCDTLVSDSSEYIDLGLPSGTLWKDANETDDYYTYEEAVNRFGDQLPTKEQYEELKDKCQWTWNGSGYNVTGPNGNSIFLPAAGYRSCNGLVDSVGSRGYYWSSTPSGSEKAWSLYFVSGDVDMIYNNRCFGQSVRLVQD